MESKQGRSERKSLVKHWMTADPYTVKPEDSVTLAIMLLEEHRINQLLVVADGRRLVGIVTDRDLRDAWTLTQGAEKQAREKMTGLPSDKIPVEAVMTSELLTVTPDDTLRAAAELMCTKRIGALPVMRETRLEGVITRSDILDAFVGRERAISRKLAAPVRKMPSRKRLPRD
jgi:CBS domain-containing protein